MTEFILKNLGLIINIAVFTAYAYMFYRISKQLDYYGKIIDKIGHYIHNTSKNENKTEISAEEKEMVKKYRLLNEKRKERLLERLETLKEEQEKESR